jgi:hypothetical protein
MLTKLVARNCLLGVSRTAFAALAVTASLIVNGLFVAYGTRVAESASYAPGALRLVFVTPGERESDLLPLLATDPAVLTVEAIESFRILLGATSTTLWYYPQASSIVSPVLVEGGYPRVPGECVVPSTLALEAGYDIGGAITAFAVDAENNGRQSLTVAGISEDALWPFVLASAARSSERPSNYLVALKTGTSSATWCHRFSEGGRGTAEPLEKLAGSAPKGYRPLAQRLKRTLASFILFVAALGVANSVALSMTAREGEAGVLRAMGLPAWQASCMYLMEAGLVSVCGAALALALSPVAWLVLPLEVAAAVPGAVARGAITTTLVGLLATGVLVLRWQRGAPVNLLRKRYS